MRISVRVLPRASRNLVELLDDGTYKLYLTTPPVNGEANAAAIKLLADHFNKAKSKVRIVSGETSKQKIVEIADD